jgi:4-carboxymuconolactone decarboxylase
LSRLPFPTPETMTPAQRAVFDAVVSGPRGKLVGPLRAALLRPDLADVWQKFGAILRYDSCMPPRLTELAIIVAARRWNSQLEWQVHAEAARKGGLGEDIIEALKNGQSPAFRDPEEADIYEFARQLLETGQVREETYAAVRGRWTPVGVVELTTLIGYYTLVSMTLNAHQIPLPEGMTPPLDLPGGEAAPRLTTIPPARRA